MIEEYVDVENLNYYDELDSVSKLQKPLRASVGRSKLAAKVAKRIKNYGSSGAASGLISSLAFTAVQGIELTNPQARHAHQLGSTHFQRSRGHETMYKYKFLFSPLIILGGYA